MLGYRVDDRREDVQHEDHGRRQARHEKDCRRTGPPLAEEPRAERRPGGGVWRELSRNVARQRQGRLETTFTCLGTKDTDWARRDRRMTSWLTRVTKQTHKDGSDSSQMMHHPSYKCAVSIFEPVGVFFYKYHACCWVDTGEGQSGLSISGSAHYMYVGSFPQSLYLFVCWKLWMSLQLPKKKKNSSQWSWEKCRAEP